MKNRYLTSPNAVAGLLLAAIGGFAIYQAAKLPFGSINQPDAGFFPLCISALIVVFALAVIAPRLNADSASESGAKPTPQAMLMAIGLIVYALLLKPVGFLVCTGLLIALMLHYTGAIKWRVALPAALASSFACYMAFTHLGVPLPPGVATL